MTHYKYRDNILERLGDFHRLENEAEKFAIALHYIDFLEAEEYYPEYIPGEEKFREYLIQIAERFSMAAGLEWEGDVDHFLCWYYVGLYGKEPALEPIETE